MQIEDETIKNNQLMTQKKNLDVFINTLENENKSLEIQIEEGHQILESNLITHQKERIELRNKLEEKRFDVVNINHHKKSIIEEINLNHQEIISQEFENLKRDLLKKNSQLKTDYKNKIKMQDELNNILKSQFSFKVDNLMKSDKKHIPVSHNVQSEFRFEEQLLNAEQQIQSSQNEINDLLAGKIYIDYQLIKRKFK